MKKLFLLSVLMLLPMLASADAVEINEIYYNLIEKAGQAEVTGYLNSYSGSVVIPESVVYEGKNYSVTSIGDHAFYECSGLTSVTIPNSVTSIGKKAFSYCSGLTSVTIPNSVTSIGEEAFCNCSGLTSVTIGNSVTSIGNSAFSGCYGLTSVHITDLAAWCNISFADYDSNPLSYAHHLYLNGEEINDLVIPNSVTSIGNLAFCNCSGLTSVTIPNSVTSIGGSAFYNCSGLTSVTIPNSVTSIGKGAFSGCSGLTSVTIPNSVTSIETGAFSDCSGLTSVTIPNSVTSIGRLAFSGCSGLTSVTIPNSVTSIEEGAFQFCSGLTSVTIPNSVTSIGIYAFSGCSGLTSVTIPNSVTFIGDGAFSGCSSLISVTIGSGVKQINQQAFAGCKELKDVYCLAENVPETNTDAFMDSYPEYSTLYVPANLLNAYKTTAPWSSFGKIVSLDGSEIPEPSSVRALAQEAAALITSNNGIITVSSEAEGQPISVYAFNGQLLGTSTISSGRASVQTPLQSGSVAIVKIGDKCVKVLMK